MKIIFVVPNKAKLLNDLFLNQVGSGIKNGSGHRTACGFSYLKLYSTTSCNVIVNTQ